MLRILLVATLILTATGAGAAILVVHPDGSGDYPTIQDAIDAAASGDTVELADGVFTGPGNRDLASYPIGRLRSASGDPSACALDAEGHTYCTDSGSNLYVVEGIGFRNGQHFQHHHAGTTEFRHCRFENSDGVAREYFSVMEGAIGFRLTSCEIMNCFGAPLLEAAQLDIDLCRFESNQARIVFGTTIEVTGTDFVGNFSGDDLLHVYNWDTYPTGGGSFTDCLFQDNDVPRILVFNTTAGSFCDIDGCRFVGNTETIIGAPTLVYELLITNSSFVGNGTGGGFDLELDTPNGAAIDIVRSIFAFRQGGYLLYMGATTPIPLFTDCNHYGNPFGDWLHPIADQLGVGCNMSEDPAFCDSGAGDLTLSDVSPCLPENNDCGVLIGAEEQGCSDPTTVPGTGAPALARLEPNCPNPFNPATRIAFTLAEPAAVSLHVYDAAGRLVAILLEGEARGTGRHALDWDAEGLPSGVYLARLVADDFTDEQKLTLLR